MPFFDELNEFRKELWSNFKVWMLFSLIFFIFPFSHPLSALFFEKIRKDLLPQGVQLIVVSPLSAFLVQAIISLFLGFFISFPFILWKILSFIFPSLYEKEKKAVLKLFLPAGILFFLGCFFSYFFLIPLTLQVLYAFTGSLGITPFFEASNFLTFVLLLTVAGGISFLLPILMVSLTALGIVPAIFWKDEKNYAFLFFLILSAIITPDGTGITMMILTFALAGLYAVGYFWSVIVQRSKRTNKTIQ